VGAIENSIWEKVKAIWTLEAEAVSNLEYSVDREELLSVIEMIEACSESNSRVLTTGSGTSGAAAKKIAHTFSCVEVPAFFMSPTDAVHGGLGALKKGDILIAVSKGGGTEEILKLIPYVKAKGGKIIGVTENKTSKLAMECDMPLIVKTEKEADSFNMLATASTIAVIAVFDAIAVVLMQRSKFTKEQFAVIHPAGAVGKKLTSVE